MTAHREVVDAGVALGSRSDPDEPTERLGLLFDAHHDALYRLARRLTNGADEARDLVQDTFLRAAKNVRRVPVGDSQEEAWLVRVMVNLQRDRWRKRKVREQSAAVINGSARTHADEEPGLLARTAVWSALNRLHPRRRAVVVLYELEGVSVAAIASLLSIRAITVRWHLSRARRELRSILAPQIGETK